MASRYVKDVKWTNEQNEFCRMHIDDYTWQGLTDAFNAAFKTNRSYDSVCSHCLKQLHLKKAFNRGDYKKGKKDFNSYPIGTEIFANGNVYVKIANDYYSRECTKPAANKLNKNWVKKAKLVLEQAYGEIPDDKLIIFLDKDHKNCNFSNLYVTDRKINFMMSKNNWHFENPELTLVALKWCELYYAIKQKRGD